MKKRITQYATFGRVLVVLFALAWLCGCQGMNPGAATASTGSDAQLSIAPATLQFGTVAIGSSGNAAAQLTATGGNVTVTAVTTTNSAFSVSGLSLPVTIPAGQSIAITVTFKPKTAASASATLSVTSSAPSSTQTEALSGTGAAASTHTVQLSWIASTSANTVGYNVYRSGYSKSCGSFSKINGLPNTTTAYVDSTVVSGNSYCYATTALDSSGQQSGYSNIVTNVQIP